MRKLMAFIVMILICSNAYCSDIVSYEEYKELRAKAVEHIKKFPDWQINKHLKECQSRLKRLLRNPPPPDAGKAYREWQISVWSAKDFINLAEEELESRVMEI